jgi:predicted lipoprotein with Yx(FWY)xxD motif
MDAFYREFPQEGLTLIMNQRLLAFCGVAAIALAACGGGGTSSTPGTGGTVPVTPIVPTATPVPTPTPVATVAPQGNLPLQEAVGASPAFVDPASHKTLYFLDVDTATGGTCTAACLSIWPVFVPTAGATAAGNVAIITRSDGTGQQWTYQGHPLYNFAGDNAADQTNGDGIPDFGGHWHVARPAAATAPPGNTTPPPCSGPYC